mmetsp:Transcript_88412/g.274854  ORF Transcript_88412/g.274854 Transcript_88412/m.274854 type:complete len:290 (+) Transcript_88412:1293-2162(+)
MRRGRRVRVSDVQLAGLRSVGELGAALEAGGAVAAMELPGGQGDEAQVAVYPGQHQGLRLPPLLNGLHAHPRGLVAVLCARVAARVGAAGEVGNGLEDAVGRVVAGLLLGALHGLVLELLGGIVALPILNLARGDAVGEVFDAVQVLLQNRRLLLNAQGALHVRQLRLEVEVRVFAHGVQRRVQHVPLPRALRIGGRLALRELLAALHLRLVRGLQVREAVTDGAEHLVDLPLVLIMVRHHARKDRVVERVKDIRDDARHRRLVLVVRALARCGIAGCAGRRHGCGGGR